MKLALSRSLIKLAAYLPLSISQGLGSVLGKLAWHLDEKNRRYALTNLALCFPELSEQERTQLAKSGLCSMAQTIVEAPSLWHMDEKKLDQLLLSPGWDNDILTAYEKGNGVILAAPHLGSWEAVGLFAGQHMKMTTLFRPPKMDGLTDLIVEGRGNKGASIVPTDASGVKSLTRALKEGQATGILPDQEPPEGSGLYVDFFGQAAYTMPLMLKLARKRKIPIFFVFAERRQKEGGYFLHAQKGGDELYEQDIELACGAMNRSMEALIRLCPQQYNWSYRRFRKQPDGTDLYKA